MIIGKVESSSDKPIEIEFIKTAVVIKFVSSKLKNPISVQTLEILDTVLCDFESRTEINTIVFTGSGDTFASGANLKEVAKLNEKKAAEFSLLGQNLIRKVYNSPKQVVAAINGFCMGGALDLALSCRKRIASPESIFAHPGTKLGIITGWGGTQLLPRLIGRKNALEIFLTAKQINANEAIKIGLIDEITEDPLTKSLESL